MAVPVANSNLVTASHPLAALGTTKTGGVGAPASGKVVCILVAFDVAVDGDNILTAKINGTAMTGGAVTATTTTGAIGKVISIFPTAANDVKRGERLEMTTDGGGAVGDAQVTYVIDQK
jgi:hypothetical protein